MKPTNIFQLIEHRDGGHHQGDGHGEAAQVAAGLLRARLHAAVQVQEGLGAGELEMQAGGGRAAGVPARRVSFYLIGCKMSV